MEIDREELAWAAGFFDGEGSVWCRGDGTGLGLEINQARPEPIERFLRIFPFGKIYIKKTRLNDRAKLPQWVFRVGRHENVQQVVVSLWPWLTAQKKEQATKALTTWNHRPKQRAVHGLGIHLYDYPSRSEFGKAYQAALRKKRKDTTAAVGEA